MVSDCMVVTTLCNYIMGIYCTVMSVIGYNVVGLYRIIITVELL